MLGGLRVRNREDPQEGAQAEAQAEGAAAGQNAGGPNVRKQHPRVHTERKPDNTDTRPCELPLAFDIPPAPIHVAGGHQDQAHGQSTQEHERERTVERNVQLFVQGINLPVGESGQIPYLYHNIFYCKSK